MSEESSTLQLPPVVQAKHQRLNPHDLRNSDLVNRFLAATPPYLYSPPAGPPNFFFSEMLRSLVQAKVNDQNARHLSNSMRRPRKRLWTPNRSVFEQTALSTVKDGSESVTNSNETFADPSLPEKPLELTNKTLPALPNLLRSTSKLAKCETNSTANANPSETSEASSEPPNKVTRSYTPTNTTVSNEPSAASLPPSDLVLPPPPPIWYPPLYPPYGIDPFHFFIDLRVSGHIYDRKKENTSPGPGATNNNNNNHNNNNNDNSCAPSKTDVDNVNISKSRHGSAFSVPPRRGTSPLALNLTSSTAEKLAITDYSACNNNNAASNIDGDDKSAISKNTNYVLQNLPRIYTTLTNYSGDDHHAQEEIDLKCESHLDFKSKDSEQYSDMSDDVVIVDHDSNLSERKLLKRTK